MLTVISRSTKPQLKEAAEILKRIEIRDLYKLAVEAIVTKEVRSKINANDIVSWQENSSLKASDLVVHCFRLDWGNGEEYPLDSMVFFESEKPDVACKMHLNKNETCQYRPKQCYEWRVRVFVKHACHKREAARAFERYIQKNDGLLQDRADEQMFGSAQAVEKF